MARTRILLADDHEEMRNFVTQMLEQEYEIVEAVADGRTFLEAASKLKPDLCLLDISMPIIDGIQAVAQLKASGSSAKVIMLTISEGEDFVSEAFKNGASGYVIKRRIATDLALAVTEVLAGRTFISLHH
ncbi:MAG TPA: response regulator transcription factor [Pyrinomonadaceae bacterium]|nr:response regulator transcription factor [Pyrinomonadaceae bacterium]